jgi:SpoIID/LytB domain protein
MKQPFLKSRGFSLCVMPFALVFGFLFALLLQNKQPTNGSFKTSPTLTETQIDAELQQSAEEALDQREGAIIVMDAQTGRVRAIVNKQLIFENPMPPGSTIKPFTALTALRSGLIKEDSSLVCRSPYRRDDFQIGCVHPKEEPPMDVVHALAHSCNYYFGKLGERINQNNFNQTLASFGFGSSMNDDEESLERIPRGRWKSRIAIGETFDLLVTPAQLITAYTAIVNGGKLFAPIQAGPGQFASRQRAALNVNAKHRALLIEGMRGAIEYGTAEKADLKDLPLNVFGKTGTASGDGNVRMQGWFVGFAAGPETKERIPNADEIKLAVLVFIKGAHGAECASVSRKIFSTFATSQLSRSYYSPTPPLPYSSTSSSLRVKVGKDGPVKAMSLEEYALGILSAESSVEDKLEALKAQAVASRTYALKHLQRHAKEGFDFCSTTHCQRFEDVSFQSANAKLVRAARETTGEILRDAGGEFVEAYYSASCGGMTANLRELWGVGPQPYLKTMRDDFCTSMPHNEWSATISSEKLLTALQSDKRSDIGRKLDHIQIVRRDSSDRAEFISLKGERTLTLRGWDFKIIVGRALGWNWLKSSRFIVARKGNDFYFRGSGFGHGLGLCQEGAHVMAERGATYRQILSRYFPTTRVEKF